MHSKNHYVLIQYGCYELVRVFMYSFEKITYNYLPLKIETICQSSTLAKTFQLSKYTKSEKKYHTFRCTTTGVNRMHNTNDELV